MLKKNISQKNMLKKNISQKHAEIWGNM